ncbi:putative deoxyribonuclease TATDN2 [Pocillopora verrucosa]|uniref:putative deoxyribonuclease TATDN2 n=1 Tax=Pocillopora verrucosa TaxID=203993 RepID=UPI00334071C0
MDGRKCFKCGKTGHLKRDCPEKANHNLQNVKCFACGRHGHFQKDCTNSADGNTADTASTRHSKNSTRSRKMEVQFPVSKSMFIDTHCHLEYVYERLRHTGSLKEFQARYPFPPNFEGCITTFCDPAAFSSFGTWYDVLSEESVWGTFGCHPHNAKYYNDELEAKIIQCLDHPKAIALGEVGLDYSSHCTSPPEVQKEVFTRQANWAVTLEKPLVVHCRDAETDTLEILKSCLPQDWRIHLHCYTGSSAFATRFFREFPNLFIGMTAVVTFAKATNIHELAFDVPLEKLLLETDAPYFVPSQVADKHNKFSNPGMAIFTAQRIAEIKGVALEEVLETVRKNTARVYGI